MSKLVYSNVSPTGVGLGNFCKFLKKKLFKSRWITFRTSSEPFQRTRFLTFQNQSKKFNGSILFLQLNPKTRLETCIMM